MCSFVTDSSLYHPSQAFKLSIDTCFYRLQIVNYTTIYTYTLGIELQCSLLEWVPSSTPGQARKMMSSLLSPHEASRHHFLLFSFNLDFQSQMLAGSWEEKFIPGDTYGHVSSLLLSATVLLLVKAVEKVKESLYSFQPQGRCRECTERICP